MAQYGDVGGTGAMVGTSPFGGSGGARVLERVRSLTY